MARTIDDLTAPEDPLEDLGGYEYDADDRGPALPGWIHTTLQSLGRVRTETYITWLVVGGAVLYVFAHLHPNHLLSSTTPTGGDMGAHVWAPAYLRDHILPHWRLSGWAPDWYAGFPAYHYYMVIPGLLVVVFDVVLPYGMALKLVSALGMLTLPVACWAFGRLAGLRFPAPQLLAAVSVLFLFDETFTIYGGNVASTMAGEFSFSIALSFGMLYFGLLARGLRTGEHRALCAALLAVTGLCHLLVAFFAVVGTIVMWLLWADRARTRWLLTMAPVAGLISAFWVIPFWWRRAYMTDMGYEKLTKYWENLFPQEVLWQAVLLNGLALVGLIGAFVGRRRTGMFLGVMGLGYALWFRFWPQSHLWNARLLPFFYLCRYFLAALGLLELVALAARSARRRSPAWGRRLVIGTPLVGVLFVVIVLGMGFHDLPGGKWGPDANGVWHYRWLGLSSQQNAFVDDWAKWNYTGYEGKTAYAEYRDVMLTMNDIGADPAYGCGRAHWEYDSELNKYGTTMAMMLLPFWTDGCIGSMEGLYFESSATTPYHFLTASAVSDKPSRPVRGLRYDPLDLQKGVPYMQIYGVKYYMAFSEPAVAQADQHPDLTFIRQSGPWRIYEVADSELVEPLSNQPVVVKGMKENRDGWLDIGEDFFLDPSSWDVFLAAGGPDEWARIEPGEAAPATPVESVTVSNISTDDDRISFTVDQVGVPVLVKASYFPNWKVSGGHGPWRVTPNLMVVIPTSTEVSVYYGRTPVDLVSTGFTLVGLGLLVVLRRKGPIVMPEPPRPVPVAGGGPGAGLESGTAASALAATWGLDDRDRPDNGWPDDEWPDDEWPDDEWPVWEDDWVVPGGGPVAGAPAEPVDPGTTLSATWSEWPPRPETSPGDAPPSQ